jgi:glycine dehydrogenase subunit 2
VRHFKTLSTKNFDLDDGLLPARLVHDEAQPEAARAVAALPGQRAAFIRLQDPRYAQGALELMFNLRWRWPESQRPAARALQPSAGLAWEARRPAADARYHEVRGEQRTKVLTPDTAHGTEPGDGDDGRLRGREDRDQRRGRGWTSTRCAPQPTRTSRA